MYPEQNWFMKIRLCYFDLPKKKNNLFYILIQKLIAGSKTSDFKVKIIHC